MITDGESSGSSTEYEDYEEDNSFYQNQEFQDTKAKTRYKPGK